MPQCCLLQLVLLEAAQWGRHAPDALKGWGQAALSQHRAFHSFLCLREKAADSEAEMRPVRSPPHPPGDTGAGCWWLVPWYLLLSEETTGAWQAGWEPAGIEPAWVLPGFRSLTVRHVPWKEHLGEIHLPSCV